MVYAQTRKHPRKGDVQNSLKFTNTKVSPDWGQKMTRKKRICQFINFTTMGKNERKQKTWKISGPCQRAKRVEEHEDYTDTNHSLSLWNSHQEPEKDTEQNRNLGKFKVSRRQNY